MTSMTVEQLPQTCAELVDRSQYRHCHIVVPDMDGKLPAIQFNHQHYYFLKCVPDRQRAIELAAKLTRKGDVVVITSIPKGQALWILEPEAQELPKHRQVERFKPQPLQASESHASVQVDPMPASGGQAEHLASEPVVAALNVQLNLSAPSLPTSVSSSQPVDEAAALDDLLPFPILLEPARFSYCQIQVPDLDETLAAIAYNDSYYSFFRVLGSPQDLVAIAKKLMKRGDKAVITAEAKRYSIWVLEQDANVVTFDG